MDWIDKANKKLEEQRANFQESLNSGEAAKRVRKYISSQGAKAVSKEEQIKKGKKSGAKNVESGHIYTLNDYPRDENQRSEAGKKGGAKNVESGWINEAQVIRSKAGAKVAIEKKESKYPEFLALIPETGITKTMAKQATVDIGYAERQWDRLLKACCEIENQVFLKNGRTNWELSTWKKK
jgi:hypothetical protein